jgi:hypothetical protein
MPVRLSWKSYGRETDEDGDLLAMLAHREGNAIESDSGIAETHAEC